MQIRRIYNVIFIEISHYKLKPPKLKIKALGGTMKWIALFIACFSLTATSPQLEARYHSRQDLTQFDVPFLLGDWFLFNSAPEASKENFLVVRLTLKSDYSFLIDIQKKDYSIDHWQGQYSLNQDSLILGIDSSTPQHYFYQANHNQLMLNGVIFTKMLTSPLAGTWSGDSLAGSDQSLLNLQSLDLILQPDFIFFFRATGQNGNQTVQQGVFYTEDEQLVLLYPHGEHNTRFQLNQNRLTLDIEQGMLYAELNRIR